MFFQHAIGTNTQITENTEILQINELPSMIIKSIIIIAFILVIFSLGSALFHLVKHKNLEQSEKTAKALTFRIAISLVLFIFVFIALATGMINPHGVGVRMQQQTSTAPAK
ncbi:MAG: twin transmembrane helix small protein [Methylobacter sp.]